MAVVVENIVCCSELVGVTNGDSAACTGDTSFTMHPAPTHTLTRRMTTTTRTRRKTRTGRRRRRRTTTTGDTHLPCTQPQHTHSPFSFSSLDISL